MKKKETYEVYMCYHESKGLVYAGSGARGRHKHCKSGSSHVFELNQIYFLEGEDKLRVEVVQQFNTKEESLKYEKDLIKKNQPMFNKVGIKTDTATSSTWVRRFKKDFSYKLKCKGKGLRGKDLVDKLFSEFIQYYLNSEIMSGDFEIYQPTVFRGLGYEHLAILARCARYPEAYSETHYCRVFISVYFELTGVDLYCKV